MSRDLIFLDVETGGLDPAFDPLIEIGWSVNGGDIKSIVVPHDTMRVNMDAAEVNGYYRRGLANPELWAKQTDLEKFSSCLINNTIVGANPAFDAAFLCASFGWSMQGAPWHYRMLDIESAAHYLLPRGDGNLRGMKGTADALRSHGYSIPEPDHTAAGDVATLIAVHAALLEFSSPLQEEWADVEAAP